MSVWAVGSWFLLCISAGLAQARQNIPWSWRACLWDALHQPEGLAGVSTGVSVVGGGLWHV